jgi:hypothetical protein
MGNKLDVVALSKQESVHLVDKKLNVDQVQKLANALGKNHTGL